MIVELYFTVEVASVVGRCVVVVVVVVEVVVGLERLEEKIGFRFKNLFPSNNNGHLRFEN
jgi:UPF0716 family protein affecting phage T7 exclusion